MPEFIKMYRASVAEQNVQKLLEVRGEAIEEARRLCPALVRAELVQLEDGSWLDILIWDKADGEALLMAHAEEFVLIPVMHQLLSDVSGPESGVVLHSTTT